MKLPRRLLWLAVACEVIAVGTGVLRYVTTGDIAGAIALGIVGGPALFFVAGILFDVFGISIGS